MNRGNQQLLITKKPTVGWIFNFIWGKLRSNFFDPGFFTGKFPKIENPGPTDFPFLVHFYFLQGRHVYWKDTFYPNRAGHFTDRKGLCASSSLSLDNYPPEELGTGLFTFLDLVINRDGISCGELWKILFGNKFVLNKFNQ